MRDTVRAPVKLARELFILFEINQRLDLMDVIYNVRSEVSSF